MALAGVLGHSLATGHSGAKWHSGAGELIHRAPGCRGTQSQRQIDVDIIGVIVVHIILSFYTSDIEILLNSIVISYILNYIKMISTLS